MKVVSKLLNHPHPVRTLVRKSFSRLPLSFTTRLNLGYLPYMYYAYGIMQAAKLARMLEIKAISAIEFGVAGGNGLLAMESHAAEIARLTGVQIQCVGFDTGRGLPSPKDYRDLPYHWGDGFYICDKEALQSRLKAAKVYWGDVAESLNHFSGPPVGFVSFDMDFYSSTASAFHIFDIAEHLPRVFCWFDDTFERDIDGMAMYSGSTGEMLAIREFNGSHTDMAIEPLRLAPDLIVNRSWLYGIYLLHDFGHPLFCRQIRSDDQIPLR